jgi:hypothetical protein
MSTKIITAAIQQKYNNLQTNSSLYKNLFPHILTQLHFHTPLPSCVPQAKY